MNTVKLFIGRVTLTLVFIYIAMVISAPDANEVNIAMLQYTIWEKTTRYFSTLFRDFKKLVYVFVSLFYPFPFI